MISKEEAREQGTWGKSLIPEHNEREKPKVTKTASAVIIYGNRMGYALQPREAIKFAIQIINNANDIMRGKE